MNKEDKRLPNGTKFKHRAKNGRYVEIEIFDYQQYSPTIAYYFLKQKKGKAFRASVQEMLSGMKNGDLII